MKNKIIKIFYILLSLCFVLPSIYYLIKNGTVLGFEKYYNFFIDDGKNKIISTIVYLLIFISLSALYIYFIKNKDCFKNIKQVLIYSGIVGTIFIIMLPWTSSDIFYYMGVGEINSVYGQNPYYVSIKEYYEENKEELQNDTIMRTSIKKLLGRNYCCIWTYGTINI